MGKNSWSWQTFALCLSAGACFVFRFVSEVETCVSFGSSVSRSVRVFIVSPDSRTPPCRVGPRFRRDMLSLITEEAELSPVVYFTIGRGRGRGRGRDSSILHELQSKLNRSRNPGWTVHLTSNNRLFYCK
ncbi:hypothetical protein V9T40_006882 [Parthenolecanium corni]|uniref:Secreted protein n=1 Tax=Parthenolecanium corni TaxID=536013 RepID=A0AAN9TRR8_9HEMI